jgi:hypothetical protein
MRNPVPTFDVESVEVRQPARRSTAELLAPLDQIVRRSSYFPSKGALSAPPKVRPRPFEIVPGVPKAPPVQWKELALLAALQCVLAEYRKSIAFAQNL